MRRVETLVLSLDIRQSFQNDNHKDYFKRLKLAQYIPVQSTKDKTPKTDGQPHSDKSFYENLPFHGLKSPPKQVMELLAQTLRFIVTFSGDKSSSVG